MALDGDESTFAVLRLESRIDGPGGAQASHHMYLCTDPDDPEGSSITNERHFGGNDDPDWAVDDEFNSLPGNVALERASKLSLDEALADPTIQGDIEDHLNYGDFIGAYMRGPVEFRAWCSRSGVDPRNESALEMLGVRLATFEPGDPDDPMFDSGSHDPWYFGGDVDFDSYYPADVDFDDFHRALKERLPSGHEIALALALYPNP